MGQKLPVINGEQAAQAFVRAGFDRLARRGRGTHILLNRPGDPVLLSVPDHDPLQRGTLRSLIRKSGMTVEEFQKLL